MGSAMAAVEGGMASNVQSLAAGMAMMKIAIQGEREAALVILQSLPKTPGKGEHVNTYG